MAHLSTVKELWTEWNYGINGGPSIVHLEDVHGTNWRKSCGKSKFFQRRNKIICAVKRKRNDLGNINDAITFLEEYRGEKGLDWLSKNMPASN